tara:strand:- start:6821 stop:7522 length:702 start_codon:yes stop_codon:yes gene_type:complete
VDFIEEIREHFEKEYPREGCGVLTVIKGKKEWIPCKNIAEDDEDFIFDSEEYLKLARTSDIVGIVHSHPDASSEPSESDIKYCNSVRIPYYIFSYPEMDLTVVEPEQNVTNDLYGREYEFGVSDCFEAMRDYLYAQGIDIPPRSMFEDNWYDKGLDYFNDDTISEWNLFPVPLEKRQINDLLIFKVQCDTNNHCGVYIGNECFYHHAINRLSCRESLYPSWHKWLVGAYRYAA